MNSDQNHKNAARLIRKAKRAVAFTGAGISVESGIPPFRGENGLWNKYNPVFLEINYFHANPLESWKLIKAIFYDFFGRAKPNAAHKGLALLEQSRLLQTIITQNIDNLHQEAGSKAVYEYHGTAQTLICTECGNEHPAAKINLQHLPPLCKKCGGLLKPDFVFFGEPIPEHAQSQSLYESSTADLFILIGTTGEIMPASMVPDMAKRNGAKIIEINIAESNYTRRITDVFLNNRATEAMTQLLTALDL